MMLRTTLNKIHSLSPNSGQWAQLLRCLGKTKPDDEPLDFIDILNCCDFYFALWCCQAIPEFDEHWRLYAVWCARQVKHLMTLEQSVNALNVVERYANGHATLSEFNDARLVAINAAEMASSNGQTAAGSSAKAAAAATSVIAGMAARDAAYAAAYASAFAAGRKAERAVPASSDDFVYQSRRAKAFDAAVRQARNLAIQAQKIELLSLVRRLNQQMRMKVVTSQTTSPDGLTKDPEFTASPPLLRGGRLQFPESRSCGKLRIFETNNPNVYENYQEHDAQGTVAVPAGWSASLLVDKDFKDFSYLADCDPSFVLDEIDLRAAVICDDDLRYFSCLWSLRKLNLRSAQITGEGLEQLHSLSNLTFLELMYSSVTDAAIRHIQSLTTLKYLNLGHTAITNECLRHLEPLIQLEELYLWGTNISDIGLRHLQPLARLKKLSLHRTRISDDGIGFIKIHRGLNSLNLEATKVSKEGKQRLRMVLPECSIS
jgi:hypothetical protein